MAHARARERAAVVLIEDLHWMDGPSATVLAHYIDTIPPRERSSLTLKVVGPRLRLAVFNSSRKAMATELLKEAT